MSDSSWLVEQFPDLSEFEITIKVSDCITPFGDVRSLSYDLTKTPPRRWECPGKCARDEYFSIDSMIRSAIQKGDGKISEYSICRGRESMGRNSSRSCMGNCRIEGTYKMKNPEQDVHGNPH